MIKTHVTNLELSRRLKELGVPQNSLFCWTDKNEVEFLPSEIRNSNICIAAFLASELEIIIPEKIIISLDRIYEHPIKYFKEGDLYRAEAEGYCIFRNDNTSNCRANLLVYLIENGIVKVEDLKC